MPNDPSKPRVSSAYTASGGGFDFEKAVAACYLSMILASKPARGMDIGTAREIRLQRSFEGQFLDDMIIVSSTVMGDATLSLQLKKDIQFGAKDARFGQVIADAHATFRSDEFVPGRDRFGIVVGTYSKNVDKYFREVPNWARRSATAKDFVERIAQPSLSHDQQRRFLNIIRDHIDAASSAPINDHDLWDFFRGFVILHFDVHEKDARDRAHTVATLSSLLESEDNDEAQSVFRLLYDIAGSTNRAAGSLDRNSLLGEVQAEHKLKDGKVELWKSKTGSPGPYKVSISRMPVTGQHVFGREREIQLLNNAWHDPASNIVSLVAWGGVGKTALVNHWLRSLGEEFDGADMVYAWSFYSQGADNRAQSGDVFVDVALSWFGDKYPNAGSAWEKGERLAQLIGSRRTLLLLDGLEPLQNPPGPKEGRLKDGSMVAFLGGLASVNAGLCVISTRLPITDMDRFSGAKRVDLEQLSEDAGALVLQSLGVNGTADELRQASNEFDGHCLALTLLGSYLADVFEGDIGRRIEIGPLENDVRHGGHARRVMESYKKWLGEGPELSLLRVLGLFDRPASEEDIAAVCAEPAIPSLTDSIVRLSRRERLQSIAKLRRARLFARPDEANPDHLDAHPLIREHFGQELEEGNAVVWRLANERLFRHYSASAVEFPETVEEMEPLFRAMICACRAGRETDAFHQIYLKRIMRGDEHYAAYTLGTLGPLLAVLSQFFEHGQWTKPLKHNPQERQGLSRRDQLRVLTNVGWFLTATKSYAAPEVYEVFSYAKSLCDTEIELFPVLRGLWVYMLVRAELTNATQLARQCLEIAEKATKPDLLVEAHMETGVTAFYKGEFADARQHLGASLALYDREKHRLNSFLYGNDPGSGSLVFDGVALWLMGYPEQSIDRCDQAYKLSQLVGHPFSVTLVLYMYAMVHQACGDVENTRKYALELIDYCTRQGSRHFLTHGKIFMGWSLYASGSGQSGIEQMETALQDHLDTGAIVTHTYHLALLSDALRTVNQHDRGIKFIDDGLKLIREHNDRRWEAELLRVLGDLHATKLEADEDAAMAAYEDSLDVARRQLAKSFELRTMIRIASLLTKQGKYATAKNRLQATYEWFSEGFDTHDLRAALEMLKSL